MSLTLTTSLLNRASSGTALDLLLIVLTLPIDMRLITAEPVSREVFPSAFVLVGAWVPLTFEPI